MSRGKSLKKKKKKRRGTDMFLSDVIEDTVSFIRSGLLIIILRADNNG